MGFPYRLALDLGTNSIGWAVFRLREEGGALAPIAVVRGGVRIFPSGRDPKSGASLAVERREARAMRRNRARRNSRKRALLFVLTEHGLFPEDRDERLQLEALDPYVLRRRGLDEPLSSHELGRVIFHLNQRRGFKSNRKTDSKDQDSSVMKAAITEVRSTLAEGDFRTVGEWLADRHERGEWVKARRMPAEKGPDGYALYVDRRMVAEEFDALWDAQVRLGTLGLVGEAKDAISSVLFGQRPLKPVEPGRCTLEPTKKRAPKALPSVQRLRVFQEGNNLKVGESQFSQMPVDLAQRDLVVDSLLVHKHRTFGQLRKTLGLASTQRFNLESAKRDRLLGCPTETVLALPEHFGPAWFEFDLDTKDEIVLRLIEDDDPDAVVNWVVTEFNVSDESAAAIADLSLTPGYSNLCLDATRKVLAELERALIPYSEAVEAAGYSSHSALGNYRQTGELLRELPYYGEALERHVGFGTGKEADALEKRIGKIANPTVHVALNQLRKVVNELASEYGPPTQVVVEVTRELKHSVKAKRDIEKSQKEQQDKNEQYRAALAPILKAEPSRSDLQKMRLWTQLSDNAASRLCPYTGEQISIERLFAPGSDVEVEHILPLSRTLDDSMANKTLSVRKANRDKGDQTPFEAFGSSPEGYDYAAILERAQALPRRKSKRFGPEGLSEFLGEAGFEARALNDTAYLSRLAREYMSLITPHDNVWVVPGQLTGLLRKKLGLNGVLGHDGLKNREDHRHHAVDAAVIGIMDRGFLQSVARDTGQGRSADSGVERLVVSPPWPTYRDSVERMVKSIHVSHRPDHSHEGGLANSTIYGLRPDGFVAIRRPLASFDSITKIENLEFADPKVKSRLLQAVAGAATPAEVKKRVADFSAHSGIRRVRTLEGLAVIKLGAGLQAESRAPRDSRCVDGAFYGLKGDSNFCIEIYADEKGSWRGEVVTTFEAYSIVRAHRGDVSGLLNRQQTQSGRPLVMRLMKNDTVRLVIDGEKRDMRVCKFGQRGQIALAGLCEGNVDSRNRDGEDTFAYLLKNSGPLRDLQARRVTVSPAGRLRDPGPPGE